MAVYSAAPAGSTTTEHPYVLVNDRPMSRSRPEINYHRVGNACGWLSAPAVLVAVVMVALCAIAVASQTWVAATVLGGIALLSLSAAVVLGLVKAIAAISSRAARESQERVQAEIEQQVGALYRAVPRECREAVKRQGELMRQETDERVARLDTQVEDVMTAARVFAEPNEHGQVQPLRPVAHTTPPPRQPSR